MIRSVRYRKCATKLTDSVCVKKDTKVPGVINAYPAIMDTQIVNHVVVQNMEVHFLIAMHRENAAVYPIFPEKLVTNVVRDIINIPSANVKETDIINFLISSLKIV